MIWDYHVTEAGEHRGPRDACELPPCVAHRCDKCHRPALLIGGRWQHAEAADAAFCQLVMTRQAVTDANQE